MLTDILTVMRKELYEIYLSGGGTRNRSRWSLLLILGVFGILLPLQFGKDWLTSPVGILPWAWVPFILVSSVTADSFAGERERHTLETLLASRLSDRAILFGKMLATVVYGVGLTWGMVLLGLVTTNISNAGAGLIFFSPELLVGVILFSLLSAAFSSSLGILLSLRSSSVRQVQQLMSLSMFIFFIPMLLLQFLPAELQLRFFTFLRDVDYLQVAVWAGVFLFALVVILVTAAVKRFKRARLILD